MGHPIIDPKTDSSIDSADTHIDDAGTAIAGTAPSLAAPQHPIEDIG